jgi:hypothetical protein
MPGPAEIALKHYQTSAESIFHTRSFYFSRRESEMSQSDNLASSSADPVKNLSDGLNRMDVNKAVAADKDVSILYSSY